MFRKKSQLIFRIYGSKLGKRLLPEFIEIRLLVLSMTLIPFSCAFSIRASKAVSPPRRESTFS